MVVGLLGILKAGGAYLPLDPNYPQSRLEYLLSDAQVQLVITQQRMLERLPMLGRVIALDEEWERIATESADNLLPITEAENLAYVIYTSGSTGQPKGVMISHGNLQQLLHGLQQTVYSQLGEEPLRVGWNASLSFDASVKQWVQLLSGHAIYLLGDEERLEAARVLDYVKQNKVQVLDTTPGQLRTWLDAGLREGAAGEQLAALLVGGEAIDEQLWQELAALEQPVTFNVYGPTECTVDATWSVVNGARAVLGQRLPHVSVYVLDEQLRLAPVGVRGELCIGGGGVGRGYLLRAELTAERYVPHPFSTVPGERLYRTGDEGRRLADGRIEYLGRRDQQVKVRGYRIELGEIEAVLESHAAVRQAVVTVREEQLVAYLVGRRGVQLHESGVREFGEGYEVSAGLRVAQQNKNETDYLYHEIFERRCYLQHGVSIERGDWVVDVGANIGLFSLQAAQMGAARVYAFEPLGAVCASLRQNARLGGGRIRVFEHGLSQTEGEAQFTYYPRYTMMSGQSEYADAAGEVEVIKRYLENEASGGSVDAASLLKDADELLAGRFTGQVQQCRLRRLTDVLREEEVKRVDLLKIDVQRAEWDVLQGLESEDWERIGQVVLEVHDWEGGSGRAAEIRELLQQKGYEVTVAQDELLVGTDRYNVYGVRRGYRENGNGNGHGSLLEVEKDDWGGGEWSVSEVREYARERLPEYMVPHRWVVLEQMPLTAHGKVDRERLPAPISERAAEREAEDEWTAVEELVAGIWNEVLKQEVVARSESFFELGGHSLLATQVISRVREVFGVEVGLRRLFEEPTLGGFSYGIEEKLRAGAGVTVPALERMGAAERNEWGGLLPLSFAQQRLWFLDQLEPGGASYNVPLAMRLKGELNIEALERTLSEIVRRHEVLRTRFVNAAGVPRQEVLPATPIRLAVTDLSVLDEAKREAVVREAAVAEEREPFDLATGPMLRVKLLRLSDEEHVVLLTMHHIVSDAWSLGVLIKEVTSLYEAFTKGMESPLPELEVQYVDFALWQRGWLQGEELERQLDYWREQLGGEVPALELPTDHTQPAVPSNRGAQERFRLSDETTTALRELSRREGVTLFMTLLAAFQTLLHRYSGQEDIVVGSPVAGRNYAETENLIGFFVNTLPLRSQLRGELSFVELLQQVKEVCLGAYAHQDVPFEKLVEELQPKREGSRSPLYQVVLTLQNAPRVSRALSGLRLEKVDDSLATGKYELNFTLTETGEGLSGFLEYHEELFEAETIRRLLGDFRRLLELVVENPAAAVGRLRFLSAAEEHEVLVERNETKREYESGLRFHEWLAREAKRHWEEVAVVAGGREISYGELEKAAEKVAARLREQGVGEGWRIGILLEHSYELIVGLLGVLKTGAAYVPLAAGQGELRNQQLLRDSGVQLVLTQAELQPQVPDEVTKLVWTGSEWLFVEGSGEIAEVESAKGLVYVMYTSGTTGKPKGVEVEEASLLNYLHWALEQYVRGERLSFGLCTSVSFDLTVTALYLPLLSGGRIVLYEPGAEAVAAVLRENQVEVLKLTPSHLEQLRGMGHEGSRLRRLIVGGEALSERLARAVVESFGGAGKLELYNEYGPTEATVGCMVHRYELGEESGAGVSIGHAAANTEIYVLDEALEPVGENVAGEIYIGGAGLARGYWQRAEQTAERFVPHPYSTAGGERLYRSGDVGRWRRGGKLEYVGRRDEQVKYKGHRVELQELRAALNEHADVCESVVRLERDGETAVLVAYYVSQHELAASELRAWLSERVVKETVPSVYVHLKKLPLGLNGKVNYQELPGLSEWRRQRERAEREDEGEWTPVEKLIAGIWNEVLKVKVVARSESFFELGGHSLLATQVVSRVREVFGVEVGLRKMFEQPTLRDFSNVIDEILISEVEAMTE